jgi:hypothetical protein
MPAGNWRGSGDEGKLTPSLPFPMPAPFITAGAMVAERAVREGAAQSRVEEILRRAVDQAVALLQEAA